MNCRIVADDFGMSVEINEAISELVGKGLVDSAGVMANERLSYSVDDLKEGTDTGLHIDLLPLSERPGTGKNLSLLRLFSMVAFNRIAQGRIIEAIKEQYDLVSGRGFRTSYLDAHQHVHILPKILKAFISCARSLGVERIRCITMEKKHLLFYYSALIRFGFISQVPKILLLYLAGMVMKHGLDREGIRYCRNLVLMPLATCGDYRGLMNEVISRFRDLESEVVVHPGHAADGAVPDDYSDGRYVEYSAVLGILK